MLRARLKPYENLLRSDRPLWDFKRSDRRPRPAPNPRRGLSRQGRSRGGRLVGETSTGCGTALAWITMATPENESAGSTPLIDEWIAAVGEPAVIADVGETRRPQGLHLGGHAGEVRRLARPSAPAGLSGALGRGRRPCRPAPQRLRDHRRSVAAGIPRSRLGADRLRRQSASGLHPMRAPRPHHQSRLGFLNAQDPS
jgi:hypothetical protein